MISKTRAYPEYSCHSEMTPISTHPSGVFNPRREKCASQQPRQLTERELQFGVLCFGREMLRDTIASTLSLAGG